MGSCSKERSTLTRQDLISLRHHSALSLNRPRQLPNISFCHILILHNGRIKMSTFREGLFFIRRHEFPANCASCSVVVRLRCNYFFVEDAIFIKIPPPTIQIESIKTSTKNENIRSLPIRISNLPKVRLL